MNILDYFPVGNKFVKVVEVKEPCGNRGIRITVYISGKITGTDDYEERFAKAEKKLARKGFIPVNPLDIPVNCNDGTPSWSDYMRKDIKRLVDCDVIYMMKGWKKSKGARLEHHIAKMLGMGVFYEDWKEV